MTAKRRKKISRKSNPCTVRRQHESTVSLRPAVGMLSRLVVLICLGRAAAYGPPDSPLFLFLRNLPVHLPYGSCRQALVRYVHSLQRGDDWAVNMYDSSTKYPDGILATNGYSLGHFDQCLRSGSDEFAGKYCLVKARFSRINSTHPMLPVSRFKFNRNEAHLAICIPSVCDAELIESALTESVYLFPVLKNFHVHATMNENHCSVESLQKDSTNNNWLWFLIMTSATVYVMSFLRSSPVNLFACFSVTKHWRKLFDRQPDAISCIHGLRVIAMSIVVAGHRAEALAAGPLFNPEAIEKVFETGFNVFLLNGSVFVDTFFTISGFLLCWNILKYQPDLTWWRIVFMRYLRLVPCYAIIVAVQALIMDDLGSGPLWKMKVGKEAANCRKNWWTNLLFINNYWDPQHICVDPSWYLACDMQFLLLGTLVILPLARWTRYKLLPLMVAAVAALVVPFFVTYSNGLDPVVIPDPSTVGRTAENQTNLLLYITGYCRAGPYLVGVATAYFLHQFLKTNKQFKEIFWYYGSYFASFCILGSIVIGWPFFTTNKVDPLLTALYAATFRSVYAIGIAYIIVYGFCNKYVPFLSAEPFGVLSKVSYSVYLVHTLWIQLSYSWIQSPIYLTDLYQVGIILSDLIICTFLGIIFHIFVECPLAEIFYNPKKLK